MIIEAFMHPPLDHALDAFKADTVADATVKKHLEHVFEKLGVETRTAAAGVAVNKVRLLAPS